MTDSIERVNSLKQNTLLSEKSLVIFLPTVSDSKWFLIFTFASFDMELTSITPKLTVATSSPSGSPQLFSFKAYNFGPTYDTIVVSFAKKSNSEDFACFIGSRAGDYNDWTEQSYFWAVQTPNEFLKTKRIIVSNLNGRNLVRLAIDPPKPGPNERGFYAVV